MIPRNILTLIVLFCIFQQSLAAITNCSKSVAGNDDEFDFTPVHKIFVKGQPVFVRQVSHSHELSLTDELLSDNLQCFTSEHLALRRQKRCAGLLSALLPHPAPAAAAPAYYPQPQAPQTIYIPSPAPPPTVVYVPGPPGPPGPCIPPAPAPAPPIGNGGVVGNQGFGFNQAPPAELQPPPLPPQPIPQEPTNFPLPECYTNSNGFMCCDEQLENTLNEAFQELEAQNVHFCSIQKITNYIQRKIEAQFGLEYELIVGIRDFASKSHFFGNHICKISSHERYVLAYATPHNEGERHTELEGGNGQIQRKNHFYQWK